MHEALKNIGLEKKFTKNQILFQEGEEAKGFYYLLDGEIRLTKINLNGKEVEVSRLYTYDYLGEVILFVKKNYPVCAQATKNSRVVFFEKNAVLTEFKKNNELALFFIRLLASKCVTLNKTIENLTLKNVRQRLINYLVTRCPADGKCTITLDLSKSELAKKIGTISETLSRNLKQLQQEELLKVDGKNIKILNCPKLRAEITE